MLGMMDQAGALMKGKVGKRAEAKVALMAAGIGYPHQSQKRCREWVEGDG